LGWLAIALAERGEFAAASAAGQEAIQVAEGAGILFDLTVACWGYGRACLHRGDLQAAIPVLERALRVCQDRQISLLFPRVASSLGQAYRLAGRAPEAVPLLEQAVEQNRAMGKVNGQSAALAWLSETYLQMGRVADALDRATGALALAREQKERGHEAMALRVLAEIAAHADPPDIEQAGDYYRQALAPAEELGMRPLVAHCHLGLGTLYQHVGQGEEAQAELSTAAELYRAMEMTFWLERAETALAQSPG
jgi:tetratricopeptide (TPR) repeat protein